MYSEEGKEWSRRRACLCLGVVSAAALLLRLYRLDHQSVWFDEAISFAWVHQPDFSSYLKPQFVSNWNLVPLYYFFQYVVANTLSDSVLTARLLSVFFGMLGLPLIYLLGAELFGRRAGLIAACCYGFSAVHIYQAQEIRNYSLTTLAALCVSYTFMKVLTERRGVWWVLNSLANLFLVWTHLFGCWLLVAQGLFLLSFYYRHGRFLLIWFGSNLLLMIPSVYWAWGMKGFIPPNLAFPSLPRILGNSFADCSSAVYSAVPVYVPGYRWSNLPAEWTRPLIETFPLFDRLFCVFFLLSAAYLAGHSIYQRGRSDRSVGKLPREHAVFFLLYWLFAPVAILAVLAYVWRADCFAQKYTTYCSLALYLVIGGAIRHLPRASLRYGAVLFLLLLYAHRAVLYETQTQRTDWAGAARYIKSQSLGNPLVFSHCSTSHGLCAEADPSFYIVETDVDSMEAMYDKTIEFIRSNRDLWVIWLTSNRNYQVRYDRFLESLGVLKERHAFYAAQLPGLLITRVLPGQACLPESDIVRAKRAAVEDFDAAQRAYSEGIEAGARGDYAQRQRACERALELLPGFPEAFMTLFSDVFTRQRDTGRGAQLARDYIAQHPEQAEGYACLAEAARAQGDAAQAWPALEETYARAPYAFERLRPYYRQLARARNR